MPVSSVLMRIPSRRCISTAVPVIRSVPSRIFNIYQIIIKPPSLYQKRWRFLLTAHLTGSPVPFGRRRRPCLVNGRGPPRSGGRDRAEGPYRPKGTGLLFTFPSACFLDEHRELGNSCRKSALFLDESRELGNSCRKTALFLDERGKNKTSCRKQVVFLHEVFVWGITEPYKAGRMWSQMRLISCCMFWIWAVVTTTASFSGMTMMYWPLAPSARKAPKRQRHI